MTWFRAVLAVVVVAGAAFIALPDEKPRYLGDMPSMLQQSRGVQSPAEAEPPVEPAPSPISRVAPRVVAPAPADGPMGRPSGPVGERPDPGPGPDTTVRFQPGAPGGDPAGPMPGENGYEVVPNPVEIPYCELLPLCGEPPLPIPDPDLEIPDPDLEIPDPEIPVDGP